MREKRVSKVCVREKRVSKVCEREEGEQGV